MRSQALGVVELSDLNFAMTFLALGFGFGVGCMFVAVATTKKEN